MARKKPPMSSGLGPARSFLSNVPYAGRRRSRGGTGPLHEVAPPMEADELADRFATLTRNELSACWVGLMADTLLALDLPPGVAGALTRAHQIVALRLHDPERLIMRHVKTPLDAAAWLVEHAKRKDRPADLLTDRALAALVIGVCRQQVRRKQPHFQTMTDAIVTVMSQHIDPGIDDDE